MKNDVLYDKNDVAIIGMACRFPGADNIEEFWKNLVSGSVSIVPCHFDPVRFPHIYHQKIGLVKDVDKFDPVFFGISPREAVQMDPQQRIFLEVAWQALENAGIVPSSLSGTSCGVFVGLSNSDYSRVKAGEETSHFYATGNSFSMASNRISYFFNLQGPSITCDTACSSSLVALHQARQSLRLDECEIALCGGCNIIIDSELTDIFLKSGMLSPRFESVPFDEMADGYVRGEGCGLVVLKSLENALRNNDFIYAVIKGSSIGQDGRTNGITAPNGLAQQSVIKKALDDANVNPGDVDFVEAHGTSTKLGDPIEINALAKAYRGTGVDFESKLFIGSVKGNIGHLESAAGVAGVIKAALVMQRKVFPGQSKLENINPLIQDKLQSVHIAHENIFLENASQKCRLVGVSSFGFGGTNAHVVLAEPPNRPSEIGPCLDRSLVFVLSAKTETALLKSIENIHAFVNSSLTNDDFSIVDFVWTLQVGRENFPYRVAIIFNDVQELLSELELFSLKNADVERLFWGKVENSFDDNQSIPHLSYSNDFDELRVLAKSWVAGASIQWEKLYNRTPSRIPVPGISFDCHSYWKSNPNDNGIDPLSATIFFHAKWALSSRSNSSIIEPFYHAYVIFNENQQNLINSLNFINASNITVFLLDGNGVISRKITKLPNFSGNNKVLVLDLSDIDHHSSSISHEIEKIWLMKDLFSRHRTSKMNVLHLTNGLFSVDKRPKTLSGALFSGFVRNFSTEIVNVSSRTVDIDFNIQETDLLRQVVEFEVNPDAVSVVALWKEGERFIPFLEQTSTPPAAARPPSFRDSAGEVCVITGGTSVIGLNIAETFLKVGVQKFVLIGKDPLPDREDWGNLALSPDVTRKIKAIQHLEKAGAKIEVFFGDLSNQNLLNEYFSNIRQNFGNILGVIHCAGFLDKSQPLFLKKSKDSIISTIEAKVLSLQSLHNTFKDDDLEFFTLFSSISSHVPALAKGIIDYSAANGYLNHFAEFQRGQGFEYYQSLCWPIWEDTKMGALVSPTYKKLGLLPLALTLGCEIFQRVVFNPLSSVVVLPCLFGKDSAKELSLEVTPPHTTTPAVGISKVASPCPATRAASLNIPGWLTEVFAEKLEMPASQLDPHQHFTDMGVDSIVLVEILNELENRVGHEIDPTLFFEFTSIHKISQHLSGIQSISPTKQKENNSFRHESTSRNHSTEIAVIGLGCNFPEAKDINKFWDNLISSRNSIRKIPSDRWEISEFFSERLDGNRSISKWGGFIDDIALFDPEYFGIAKEEAANIDPLIRKCLEVCSITIADGGYLPSELGNNKVGLFVGARTSNYMSRIKKFKKNSISTFGQNFIANSVSNYLNLTGPSMVIDTACSSSMVSVHLACKSLLAGDCNMALVGGVELLLDEYPYLILSEARALSPDGKCATFDAKANGFVPGEGCGAVMLKPLADAMRDDDHIYAVIESSAINNDGKTMGITTPNLDAQVELLTEAYGKVGVNPRTISYIEAHGTGTKIGDPIELKALKTVFENYTGDKQFCGIGSVKTNIGHLLSASGIAGLIKSILVLEKKTIPPTLNCENPNPRFDFQQSPFFIVDSARDISPVGDTIRVGVSSFGFGGTNVHILLKNSPDHKSSGTCAKANSEHLPIKFNRDFYWLEKRENPFKSLSGAMGGDAEVAGLLPILEGGLVGENSYEYFSVLNSSDFVINNHTVYHVNLMPGVTFIDAVYRLVKKHNPSVEINKIRLRNIVFPSPVSLADGDTAKIKFIIHEPPDSTASITIYSKNMTTSSTWEERFRCELWEDVCQSKRIDINDLKSRSDREIDMEEIYSLTRKIHITHSGYMKVPGKLFVNDDYLLAELHITPGHFSKSGSCFFHPALLDVSTIISLIYDHRDYISNNSTAFIPFFIEEYFASPTSDQFFYVFIQRDTQSDNSRDILTTNIEIYDTSSHRIVNFSKFTAKSTRSHRFAEPSDVFNFEDIPGVSFSCGENENPVPILNDHIPIIAEIKEAISNKFNISLDLISDNEEFYNIGLDSLDLLNLVDFLEQIVGEKLYPTTLFEYNTVKKLSGFLVEKFGTSFLSQRNKDVEPSQITTSLHYYSYDWKNPLELSPVNHASPLGVQEFCVAIDFTDSDNLLVSLDNLYEKSFSYHCFHPDSYSITLGSLQNFFGDIDDDSFESLHFVLNLPRISLNIPEFIGEILNDYVYPIFHFLKLLSSLDRQIHFTVIYEKSELAQLTYGSLPGFFKSLHHEKTNFFFSILELEPRDFKFDFSLPSLFSVVKSMSSPVVELKIANGRILQKQLVKIESPDSHSFAKSLTADDVVLITGGTGGIGLIVAENLVASTRCNVIISSRNSPDGQVKQKIEEINSSAEKIFFKQTDVTNKIDVQDLIAFILEKFGKIDVIIHAAGVINDCLFTDKSLDSINATLSPKIQGTVLLDQATKGLDIKYFYLFSSFSSVIGNIGQTDYAFANNFLDNFARFRNTLQQSNERKGTTVSINWPLWENGGMQLSKETLKWFRHSLGIIPLTDNIGMKIFEESFEYQSEQVIVVQADESKISHLIAPPRLSTPKAKARGRDRQTEFLLREHVEGVTCHHIASSENGSFEVFVCGHGAPVLLIPAFGMSAYSWVYQIAELSSFYKLFIVHLPGHGNSSLINAFSLSDISSILIETLGNLSVSEPISIVGASFGSLVAQYVAAHFPDSVDKLILVNGFSQLMESFTSLPTDKQLKTFIELGISDISAHSSNLSSIGYIRKPVDIFRDCQTLDPLDMVKYLNLAPFLNTSTLLETIQAPTLVVSSEADQFADTLFLSEMHGMLCREIPNSTEYCFPTGGHFPYLTVPNEFNDIVLRFLNGDTLMHSQKKKKVGT